MLFITISRFEIELQLLALEIIGVCMSIDLRCGLHAMYVRERGSRV